MSRCLVYFQNEEYCLHECGMADKLVQKSTKFDNVIVPSKLTSAINVRLQVCSSDFVLKFTDIICQILFFND